MKDGGTKKSKRETLGEDLFKEMVKIINKPPSVINDFYYRFNNTLTREEFNNFKVEGVSMIQKVLKINKKKAISAFNWFYKEYGLRIKG